MILYLPRLVLDVSKVFHLAQVVKPLMSIWSYMYLVNKNYGKDYPLAREDIYITLLTHIWWDDSKARNRVLYIYQIWSYEFLFSPIHCSLINGEKSQFHGPFLRSSENSRFVWITKLQEKMALDWDLGRDFIQLLYFILVFL